ncbi:hypothetical protein NKG94_22910 [Micromonospora sp. M12]
MIVERELLILTTRGHGDADLDFHLLPCRPGTLLRVHPVRCCAAPAVSSTPPWSPGTPRRCTASTPT